MVKMATIENGDKKLSQMMKKVRYRKQIARQLRTQYVQGLYSNSVTLKSGSFKVIQNGADR